MLTVSDHVSTSICTTDVTWLAPVAATEEWNFRQFRPMKFIVSNTAPSWLSHNQRMRSDCV